MAQAAVRTRHNRTIIVDFHDEATYFRLLDDGKAFVEFVLACVLALGFQLTHTATCRGGRVPVQSIGGSLRLPLLQNGA